MSLTPASFLRAGANSPIARRLASGGFWSLAGEGGGRALSFATAIVVAQLLGVAEFGAFALVQTTLFMLTTFSVFGMGHTSVRYVAAYRDTDPSRAESISGLALRFAAAMGLLISVALFISASYIATTVLHAPELAGPLRLVSPALIFYAISGAMSGTLLGFEAFQRIAQVSWGTSLVNFLAVVTGVWLWGLQGAIVGLVASELLRCAVMMLSAREVMRQNNMRLFSRPRAGDAKVLWRYSLPLFLIAILNVPVVWLCQTMIARQPNGLVEIGFYNAAQKWMTLVLLVPVAISGAFMPVLSNLSGSGDRARFHRATGKLALVQLVLTAVPAAGVALAAPWAARIFGQDFVAATPVVVVMIAIAPIYALKHFYWQVLTSGGHAWTALAVQVFWAAPAVTLTWAWQTGGALALAQAMLAAYAVTLIASFVVTQRIQRG